MTLQLKRVKVADIMPLEDEFGNQIANRDMSLEVNQEYVSELAKSFGPSGEPDEPVKLVEDGDKWRIKAGNCRTEAMKELGTEECWALIDDEDTVQSVLETVIRTNHKKKYEDLEFSRYTQQLALFVDDDYVSDVTGIEAEKIRGIRRARKAIGAKADTMTLDRLLVLDEFEGDSEAIDKLMSCREDKLENVTAALRRERDDAERLVALEAAAKAARLPLGDDANEGRQWLMSVDDPDELNAKVLEACADNLDVHGKLCRQSWQGPYITLYGVPMNQEEANAEKAENERIRREAETACEAAIDAREEWFMAQVRADAEMPATSALLREVFMRHKTSPAYNSVTYAEALDITAEADEGARIDETMNQLCRFVAWWWLPAQDMTPAFAGPIAFKSGSWNYQNRVEGYLELGEAMVSDGYEPGKADQFMTELCKTWLAEIDDEEGDEE